MKNMFQKYVKHIFCFFFSLQLEKSFNYLHVPAKDCVMCIVH